MRARKTTRLVHEGRYAAEVEIELLEEDHEWAPYLSMADVKKLDEVRLALQRGDLAAAGRLARVYELKPVKIVIDTEKEPEMIYDRCSQH